MMKLKIKKKTQLHSVFSFILIFCSLYLTNSCSTNSTEKNNRKLPIIGHYDVVTAPIDGYEVGDTLFHKVPEWNCFTEDSVRMHSNEVKDKIWIANFFFATCPTICVPMNESLQKIVDSLSQHKNNIAFLSFTIDPKRDTQKKLREYRKEHGFTARNWLFLRGNQKETHKLALEGFQLLAKEDNEAPGGFVHSSSLVLVDKNKHIRGIYNSLEPEQCQQLIKDVRLLLQTEK